MTAPQSRKSARRVRRLSTGHGRARSDIRRSSQIGQTPTAFDSNQRRFQAPLRCSHNFRNRAANNQPQRSRHSNPHNARRTTKRSPSRGFLIAPTLTTGSAVTRQHLDSFEHDGTVGAIGMTIRRGARSRVRSLAPQPCSGGPTQEYFDAVMRIGSGAPKRRTHSPFRH